MLANSTVFIALMLPVLLEFELTAVPVLNWYLSIVDRIAAGPKIWTYTGSVHFWHTI